MNNLEEMLHLYVSPTCDEKAQNIVNNEIYNNVSNITLDGIMKETILNDRYYLHTIPEDKVTKYEYDLILFYHGSRDIAWAQVLEHTDLLKTKNKYIIAFGQASG